MRKHFIAAALAASICAAAEGRLNGPVSALVLDRASHSIRPVIGVPGSAYLGAQIAEGVDASAIAPSGAAGLCAAGGSLYLMRSAEGADWSSVRIAEGLQGAVRIAWRPDSSAAGVLDEGGILRVWNADGTAAGSVAAGGAAAALAAGPAKFYAAMAGGIYALEAGAEAQMLARADDANAVAAAGADVLFTDRARGEAWRIRNGELALIAKIDDPVGIGVSRGTIAIASASGRKAIGVRAESWEPLFDIALDFVPSGVDAFSDSAWLLNAGQTGPLQVLALENATAAVYFIPAGQERN